MMYRIDGERPYEVLTEEEREEWCKKRGLKKCTEEESARALENFYNRFPEERPQDYKQNK